MLTFKRYSIKCPDDEKELFMHLFHDTKIPEGNEDVRTWVFRENPLAERKFAGYVDREQQEFTIRATRTDLLGVGASAFEMSGKVTRRNLTKTIEIGIGFHWWQLLVMIFWTVVIGSAAIQASDGIVGWLVLLALTIWHVAISIRDLNLSQEKLNDYIESHRRIQARRVLTNISSN